MRKIAYPAIGWTLGMFAFLGSIYTFTQGFGGIIAGTILFASALGVFPPTNNWLKPKLSSIYRKPVRSSALTVFACFLMIVGFLATPVEYEPTNNQAFAGENLEESTQVSEQEENQEEAQDYETIPLINKLVRDVPQEISKIFDNAESD